MASARLVPSETRGKIEKFTIFEHKLRGYNSGDYLFPNRVHAFGKNTNHPYDIAPVGTRFPYTEMREGHAEDVI
jgi:hypothetical protein